MAKGPRRSPLLATLGFSLGLTLVFTLVTYILPQVEGEAPKETEVKLGELTMDGFVALGQELFEGKGTCTLCHKPPPMGRAPDIQGFNMVDTAKERLADERYKGEAGDPAAYIRESLVDPSKYVVVGWGQKGSNDTVSPMPAIDKPPIQLSPVEMDAVIAYLQAKDGNEVSVALPTEAPAPAEKAAAVGAAPAPAKTPEEAVAKYGCQACHSMLGTESPVGPPLSDVGARLSQEQIIQSILEPDAEIAEGFSEGVMPGDFAEKMTVRELEMIIELLRESRG
ncbi:MAG: c-type cytochrome [Pseudomonadota bacterium]|nr:c-type cytochrome [Pseudomonadota bacterium]